MAKKRYALVVMAAALVFGSLAMVSCGEEEPEEIHYSEYDDSTGLAITDSITVIFNGVQWKTKTFTANIVKQENSVYKWAYINAHKPGSRFPAIYLKMYLGKGNHTTYMTFNDPGLGYITPGALTGDPQGGGIPMYTYSFFTHTINNYIFSTTRKISICTWSRISTWIIIAATTATTTW